MQSSAEVRAGSYLQETEERSAELLQHMVDLHVQIVGLEERAPPLENGVCNLQHANVGGRVIRQLRNEILGRRQKCKQRRPSTS